MTRVVPANPSGRVIMACALIAVASTVLSLSISSVAGWSRGDTTLNAVLWAALGILATTVAHLFIAVARVGTWPMKVLSGLIWAGCMTFAVVSHASYFLASQQANGEMRGSAIEPPRGNAERPVSKILTERSRVESEIAELARPGCAPQCAATRLRIAALKSHIAALDQEAKEVRLLEAEFESYRQTKERAQRDPALWALAAWSSMPVGNLQLLLSMIVGVLLDGVGCTCWVLLLSPRLRDPVTPDEPSCEEQVAAVTSCDRNAAPEPSDIQQSDEEQRLAALLADAKAAIGSGQLRNTVRALREHLKCSQGTAMMIGRMLKATP